MIINKFNIEKWMFDYFEGNLTVHEKIEFERFLESNPQFEDELEFWEDSYNSAIEFPVYEVPNVLLRKTFSYNKNIIYSIGLLFIIFSSTIGVSTFYNSFKNEEKSTKLADLGLQNEIDKVYHNFFMTSATKIELDKKEKDISEILKGVTSSKNKSQNSSFYSKLSQVRNNKFKIKNNKESIVDRNTGRKTTYKSINNVVNLTEQDQLNKKFIANKLSKKSKLKIQSKKMLAILIPALKTDVVPVSDKIYKENSKYNYLEFKRQHRGKRRKLSSIKDIKSKDRDKEFWDNIALIGNVLYNNKNNVKPKKVKKTNFLTKLKNRELALTNTHDPLFIKVNSNPIENNLALVGGLNMTRIKTTIANTWRSSYNAQNRGFITGDTYLEKLNAGIGFTAFTSQMNNSLLKTSSFGVTYSQRIQLKENSSLNIGLKYAYNKLQKNSLNTDNSTELEFKQNKLMSFSNYVNQEIRDVSHNFSTAVWYDGRFLYGGINIDNIKSIKKQNNNANEFAEYINPFKFAIQLGTDYRRNVYSALIISPQVNYSYELNRSNLWLGSSLKYKQFVTGVGLSLSNAYKVNIGIQGDKVRLIYAFDYSKSRAESKFYASHEISFRYLLRRKNS